MQAVDTLIGYQHTYPIDNEEPTSTGFQLANQTDLTLFEDFDKAHPQRAERLRRAMSSQSVPDGILGATCLLRTFDWASLETATIVDIGGGQGHFSRVIAEANQTLSFIVQD